MISHLRNIVLISLLLCDIFAQAQWTQIPALTSSHMLGVATDSSGKCLTGGSLGQIFYSNDEGINWDTVTFSGVNSAFLQNATYLSFSILNHDTLFAAGRAFTDHSPLIIRSQNGGLTWSIVYNAAAFSFDFVNDIQFLDNNLGIAVGDDGLILKTTDGGSNWTNITSSSVENLYGLINTNGTNWVAVGQYEILTSSDNGDTWTLQSHPGKTYNSVSYDTIFSKVYIAGKTGSNYFYRSSLNNGLTWDSLGLNIPGLYVYCLGGDTLINLSYNSNPPNYDISNVTVSFDGGTNFHLFGNTLVSGGGGGQEVEFEDDFGIAVGDHGKIYRFDRDSISDLFATAYFTWDSPSCTHVNESFTPTDLTADSYEWFVDDVLVSNSTILNYTSIATGISNIKLVTTLDNNTDTIERTAIFYGGFDTLYHTLSSDTICPGEAPWLYLDNLSPTGMQYLITMGNDTIWGPFDGYPDDDESIFLGILDSTIQIELNAHYVTSCGDTLFQIDSVTVFVESTPDSNLLFHPIDSLVCYEDSTLIIVLNSNPDYNYQLYQNSILVSENFGNNDTLFLPSDPITSKTYFTMTVLDGDCSTELIHLDSVLTDQVNSWFDVGNGQNLINAPIHVNTNSVNGATLEWFADGQPSVTNNMDSIMPTIKYDTAGYFNLQLVAHSANIGCTDTTSHEVTVYLRAPTYSGELCWKKNVELHTVMATHVDHCGNFIVASHYPYHSSPNGNRYFTVIQKYDINGDLLWEIDSYDYPENQDPNLSTFIVVDIDSDKYGNIYLAGTMGGDSFGFQDFSYSSNVNTKGHGVLHKIDPEGNRIWTIRHGYEENDFVPSGTSAHITDVICTEDSVYFSIFSPQPDKLFLPSGTITTLTGPDAEIFIVCVDSAGNLINYHTAGGFSGSPDFGGVYNPNPASYWDWRSARINPKMRMGSNGKIYVAGHFKNNVSFGSYILNDNNLSVNESNGYLAILDPQNGWTNAITTHLWSTSLYGGGFSDYVSPLIPSFTLDSDNNVYQTIFWDHNAALPQPVNNSNIVIGGNSYGGTGSALVKYDSNLNQQWLDRQHSQYYRGLYYSDTANQIYFCGSFYDYFGTYSGGLPKYGLLDKSMTNCCYPFWDANNIHSLKTGDGFIGGMDTDGEILWLEQIGGEKLHSLNFIGQVPNGDIIISGSTQDLPFNSNTTPFELVLDSTSHGFLDDDFMFKLSENGCDSIDCQLPPPPPPPLQLEEKKPDENLFKNYVIYPNPVKNTLYVHPLKPIENNIKIEIYDMTGAKVYQDNFYGNTFKTIDLTNYNSGVYFISLLINEYQQYQKFIKE